MNIQVTIMSKQIQKQMHKAVFNRTMHDEDKNTYLYVNQNTPVKPNPISYNTTTAILFLTHQAHHE